MSASQYSDSESVLSGSSQEKATNRTGRPKPKTNEDMINLMRQIAGDILGEWDRQIADENIENEEVEEDYVSHEEEEVPNEIESDAQNFDKVALSHETPLGNSGKIQPIERDVHCEVISGEHLLKNERSLSVPDYAVLAHVDLGSLEESIFNDASFTDEKDESFIESVWSEMAQEFTVPDFSIEYTVCGNENYVGHDDSYTDDSFSSDTLNGGIVLGGKFDYDAPDPASPIDSTPPYFPSQDTSAQIPYSLSINMTSVSQRNPLAPLVSAESSTALRLQNFLASGENFVPY